MKPKIALGCTIPLLVLGLGTWWAIHSVKGADSSPERYYTVTRGDVEAKVTDTGTIEPLKKVEVKSKVAGRVADLRVEEGSEVQAGMIVAVIDPTEINSQVAQIQAQLDGARARHQQATRGASLQVEQTGASIEQMREAVHNAEALLRVAEEQNKAQPRISGSAVAQAQANLKAARENLELLKSSTHPQAVTAAESGYEEAFAAELNSRTNLDRQQRLLEKGFVSKQVVDSAKADLASMVARLQQAKKRRDLIQEQNRIELAAAESRVAQEEAALETAKANAMQVAVVRHQVDAARAATAQARAQLVAALSNRTQDKMKKDEVVEAKASVTQLQNQLDEVKVHQSDTTLVAPMSGVVTKRYIEKGELVTSGISTFSTGTPVMQIADLSRMLVKMSVNEVDVQRIHLGLPVEVTVDAVRGVVFHGTVTKIAPAAVGATNPSDSGQAAGQQQGAAGGVIRFAVEVTVNHPDRRLRPGMSAKCAIIIARKHNVLRLLNNGVKGADVNASVDYVSTETKDGKTIDKITPRMVVVGVRGESHLEIVSGLKEGDRVKPGPYTGPKRKEIEINAD